MTEVSNSLSGIHARSERSIQATQDWERGRIDSEQLSRRLEEDVAQLVSLQRTIGFEFISDGQLTTRWQDIFTPITSWAEGIKKGPLVRWFNTNTFYYVPVVDGALSIDGAKARLTEERLLAGSPSKAVLPDPLTFADCADDRLYGSSERLMFAYSDGILRPLLKALESSGVGYVQFSAPSLVARFRGEGFGQDVLSQVAEALRSGLKGCHVRTSYHTFFGDSSQHLPFLLDAFPTDDVGVDLSETDPSDVGHTEKGLVAGAANARSSYVETPAEIARRVRPLLDKTKRLVLSPSCDLMFVPRTIADEKLKNLARARRLLG